jgi:hypothetical protein
MRWIILALILMAAAPAANAQTLLETVLYVLTLSEAKDDGFTRVTVEEDDTTLRSDTFLKSGPHFAVEIVRKDDCVFDIDRRLGVFSARYTVDFTRADLGAALYAPVRNRFGRSFRAVTIPNARYCLAAGTPYLNAIEVGSCANELSVEISARPKPGDLEKMLAAIRRLRALCQPRVS